MIQKKEDVIRGMEEENGTLRIYKLLLPPQKPEKVRTYAKAVLAPGGEVEFHVHEGESETYFFLSGEGLYSDNGTEMPVSAGDVTFTADGEGHGIKNTGHEDLHFMVLIVRN